MPTEIHIDPRNGRLFADPAVPVRVGAAPIITRKPPPFGLTSLSGWFALLSGGLFVTAVGAGIVTRSPTVHAIGLWASILVALFAAGFYLWIDPLPGWRVLLLPVVVPASFALVLLSFSAVTHAPGWFGWSLVIAGLLAVAVPLVPLSMAWVDSSRRLADDFTDQPMEA